MRLAIVLIGASLAGCAPTADAPMADVAEQSVIYGADDRLDYYELSDPDLIDLADATAMLVDSSQLSYSGGSVTVSTPGSYGSHNGLCFDEPYYNQPDPGSCTGFLVGDRTLVTAGHCVSNSDCSSTRFVFGFRMNNANSARETVSTSEVYSCSSVLARENSGNRDYSVIRLDRDVTGRTPLPVRSSGTPTVGMPLVLSGYPSGLPVKVAGGANIKAVTNTYLDANVDAYGGNSGSPVINANTGEVEGILVSGQADFEWAGGCYTSNTCSNNNGCPDFEQLTRASLWEQYIPDAPVVSTCTEDSYEENDTFVIASLLPVGTTTGLSACANDNDWFAFDVEAGDEVTASISFTHSLGNLALQLYSANGTLVDTSNGNGNSETVSATAASDGLMYVRITGSDDNTYSLTTSRTPATQPDLVLTAGSAANAGSNFTWRVTGADANDPSLYLVSGTPGQTTTVPGCPSLSPAVGSPWVVGQLTSGSFGTAAFTRRAPFTAAGRTYTFQVASLDHCRISNPLVVTF